MILVSLAILLFVLIGALIGSARDAAAGDTADKSVECESTCTADEAEPVTESITVRETVVATATAEGSAQESVTTTETTTTTTSTPAPTPAGGCSDDESEKESSPCSTPTPTPPTAAFGEAWDEYWKSQLEPLAGSVGFIAGAALAMFVLARLLMELPPIRMRQSSRVDRRIVGTTGISLLVSVPLVISAVGAATQQNTLAPDVALLLALGAEAIIGAIALACWLASRMRLDLTVTSEAKDADATTNLTRDDVLRRLHSIAGPSRAVEVPTGAELETLSTSLTALSSQGWIEGVKGIVLFVLGIVPWKITVTQHGVNEASVSISRHDRLRKSARVRLASAPYGQLAVVAEAIAPPPDKPKKRPVLRLAGLYAAQATPIADAATGSPGAAPTPPNSRDLLATVIAAHVLVELAATEDHDFAPALMGATSPTSIALVSIAIGWLLRGKDPTDAVATLEAATLADPYNRLAQWMLDYARNRAEVDPDRILAYGERLRDRLTARKIELGSVARTRSDAPYKTALATLAAMTRNYLAQRPTQGSGALATDAHALLTRWVDGVAPTTENRMIRARVKIDLLALRAARGEPGNAGPFIEDAALAIDPILAYSLGCYLVRWERRPLSDDIVRERLATGLGNPAVRDFMPIDPELTSVLSDSEIAGFLAANR
ncbi:hypothetical protein GCM10017607_11530 [Microbacterium thalassium]|nr:hypothetical protein GCM10017607_11530 [Microbacterium thalassium]